MSAQPFSLIDTRFDALRPLLLDSIRDGDPVAAHGYAVVIADVAADAGIETSVHAVLKAGKDAVETVASAARLIEPATIHAEVERLAKLSVVEYERRRKDAADQLGVRAGVLDRLVTKARGGEESGQGSALLLDDVEPAASPVPLSELLDGLKAAYARHVVLPPCAADAVALWTAATWAVDHVHCAPILNVRSPERRCGKTTLMEVIGEVARRPLPAASITPAALFRTVEAASPTLLIDEGDAFLKGNEELRGVINAGHTRATAYVVRTVGDDHEPRRFSVFGFKAIALIGKAADTITDRSIVIELRRKLPSEKVTKLRRPQRAALGELRTALARWALDDAHRIADAEPATPDSLNDRAADSWSPLIAIADLAGGDWPDRARRAAAALSGHAAEGASIGVELLVDVRAAFDARGVDRISGADLLAALLADEERPWATFNNGRPLSQAQLARRLSAFGIVSKTVRLSPDKTPRGYHRDQFNDAFARYLPSPPFESATPPQASTGAGCGGFQNRNTEDPLHFEKAPQASTGAGCGGVALSNPRTSESDDGVPL